MFGTTIEVIRKNKNISINELCDGIFTRAAYHRFVTQQSDTSTTNFFLLLEKLKVTPEELLIMYDKNHSLNFFELLSLIEQRYLEKDVASLLSLSSDIQKDFPNPIQRHLITVIQSKVDKLLDREHSECYQHLIDYLLNTEFWTRYELALFSHCIGIFNLSLIDTLLTTSLKHFEKTTSYYNESVHLVANALIVSIEHQSKYHFEKWLTYLNAIQLKEKHFFESLIVQMFTLFNTYMIDHNDITENKILDLIKFCESIRAHNYKNLFLNLFSKIKTLDW